MANYKVIIDKVEGKGTNFEGEGSSIKTALKRAVKEMEADYGRGVQGYVYSTYEIKASSLTGETKEVYLQTLGSN